MIQVDETVQAAVEDLEKTMPLAKAQTQIANTIVEQAKSNPKMLEKLKNWAGTLGESVISDVAKTVLTTSMRSLGIPLP